MWLFTAWSGSEWSVVLSILAVVALLISSVTILIGAAMSRQSAPIREVVFRAGLCLVAVGPLLALMLSLIIPENAPATAATPVDRPVAAAGNAVQAEPESFPQPAPVPARERVAASVPETIDPIFITKVPATTSRPVPPSLAPPLNLSPEPVLVPSPVAVSTSQPTERPVSQPVTISIAPPQTTSSAAAPVTAAASRWWPLDLPVFLVIGLRWMVGFWILGCLVAVYTVGRDLIRVWRLQRQLEPCVDESIAAALTEAMQMTRLTRRPEVFVSDYVGSPCTSGVWRPILILPQSMLDQSEMHPAMQLGVLTHECAHIARRDVAWALLARMVQSIYWWEPGLRRIVRVLSHLREEICDNHVLCSSIDVRLYAKALVDFAAAPLFRPLIGVIGMVANDNPLSDRVERLLDESPDKTTRVEWHSRRGIAYFVLVACGVIGIIGASSKVAGALAQVLLPAIVEPSRPAMTSRPAASDVPPSVPYWSGESRARKGTPAAEFRRPIVAAEAASRADTSPFAPPLEAGSGVANSASPDNYPVPVEAGSGVSNTRLINEFSEIVEPSEPSTAARPSTESKPSGSAKSANPSPRRPVVITRYRSVATTVIVDGKPTTVTRMVPYTETVEGGPSRPTDENLGRQADENFLEEYDPRHSKTDRSDVPEPHNAIRSMKLQTTEPALPSGTRVIVLATLPASENLLPQRVYVEGLAIAAPILDAPYLPDNSEEPAADLILPSESNAVPPAPPAAAPADQAATTEQPASPDGNQKTSEASHLAEVEGILSTIDTLSNLQTKGAVFTVIKDDSPAVEPAQSGAADTASPDDSGTVFRMSLEAIANEAGQWSGLRCWGRDLPGETPEQRLTELSRLLTRWKDECGTATYLTFSIEPQPVAVSSATGPVVKQMHVSIPRMSKGPAKLVVVLRVFDSMRYSDVQSIVSVCEPLQIQVQVITGTSVVPAAVISMAYTSAELTLVYDKKGQKVGDHAVLLAEKSDTTGVQVISNVQFDDVLSSFAKSQAPFRSTLLLKVDPDLSLESLLSFIVRANRAGIAHVELLPRDELRMHENDRLIPLIRTAPHETPANPHAPGNPALDYFGPGDNESEEKPPLLAPPVEEGVYQLNQAEPEPSPLSKPVRVRWNPAPIPPHPVIREI